MRITWLRKADKDDKERIFLNEFGLRKKARFIMEFIEEKLNNPTIFKIKKNNHLWYTIEEGIIKILKRKD